MARYIPAFEKTTVAVSPPPGAIAGTPVSVVMTQLLPATRSDLHGRFRTLVYQSLVAPPR